jgi:hypothetical protein
MTHPFRTPAPKPPPEPEEETPWDRAVRLTAKARKFALISFGIALVNMLFQVYLLWWRHHR